MTIRRGAAALVGVVLLSMCATMGLGQVTLQLKDGEGHFIIQGEMVINAGGEWGLGSESMKFEQFMRTLTELNMTPDFTLDKAAKQKLQDLRDEFRKAQAKFMEDHKEDFQNLGKERAAAFEAQNQEKLKELTKAMQELRAKGPSAEEYVAKAKVMLTPDQQKVVEAKIAKAEEERKAMERSRRNEETEDKQPTPVAR